MDSGQSISLQSLGSLLPELNNPTSAGHLRPAKVDHSLSKDSCCWWLLCGTVLCTPADLLVMSHVILNESLKLFIAHLEYPRKWCTFSAVWLLHGWCHVKLVLLIVTWLVPRLTAAIVCYMAGATWNCCYLGRFYVQHTTMHHVTSLHTKSDRIKENQEYLFVLCKHSKQTPFIFEMVVIFNSNSDCLKQITARLVSISSTVLTSKQTGKWKWKFLSVFWSFSLIYFLFYQNHSTGQSHVIIMIKICYITLIPK